MKGLILFWAAINTVLCTVNTQDKILIHTDTGFELHHVTNGFKFVSKDRIDYYIGTEYELFAIKNANTTYILTNKKNLMENKYTGTYTWVTSEGYTDNTVVYADIYCIVDGMTVRCEMMHVEGLKIVPGAHCNVTNDNITAVLTCTNVTHNATITFKYGLTMRNESIFSFVKYRNVLFQKRIISGFVIVQWSVVFAISLLFMLLGNQIHIIVKTLLFKHPDKIILALIFTLMLTIVTSLIINGVIMAYTTRIHDIHTVSILLFLLNAAATVYYARMTYQILRKREENANIRFLVTTAYLTLEFLLTILFIIYCSIYNEMEKQNVWVWQVAITIFIILGISLVFGIFKFYTYRKNNQDFATDQPTEESRVGRMYIPKATGAFSMANASATSSTPLNIPNTLSNSPFGLPPDIPMDLIIENKILYDTT